MEDPAAAAAAGLSRLDLSASSPNAAHARSGHCGSLLSDTDTRSLLNRDPTELLT